MAKLQMDWDQAVTERNALQDEVNQLKRLLRQNIIERL